MDDRDKSSQPDDARKPQVLAGIVIHGRGQQESARSGPTVAPQHSWNQFLPRPQPDHLPNRLTPCPSIRFESLSPRRESLAVCRIPRRSVVGSSVRY